MKKFLLMAACAIALPALAGLGSPTTVFDTRSMTYLIVTNGSGLSTATNKFDCSAGKEVAIQVDWEYSAGSGNGSSNSYVYITKSVDALNYDPVPVAILTLSGLGVTNQTVVTNLTVSAVQSLKFGVTTACSGGVGITNSTIKAAVK